MPLLTLYPSPHFPATVTGWHSMPKMGNYSLMAKILKLKVKRRQIPEEGFLV